MKKNIMLFEHRNICTTLALSLLIMLATFLPSSMAWAATTPGSDPIGDTMCTVVKALTGKIGKAICTMAIIFLAIGLFVGKISWGVAIAVGIGIGGIFGAEAIVNWLATGSNNQSAVGTTCGSGTAFNNMMEIMDSANAILQTGLQLV